MDSLDSPDRAAYRLLLCDDSPIERLALGHFLRHAGFEVDEAADGDSAMEHLKNRQVDLMLLDLHMPGADGFDVLSYVQEHRRSLPVIVLSGMPPDEIQHKMHGLRERQLPTLFLKPVDPEALLNVVEMRLSGELSDDGPPGGPDLIEG